MVQNQQLPVPKKQLPDIPAPYVAVLDRQSTLPRRGDETAQKRSTFSPSSSLSSPLQMNDATFDGGGGKFKPTPLSLSGSPVQALKAKQRAEVAGAVAGAGRTHQPTPIQQKGATATATNRSSGKKRRPAAGGGSVRPALIPSTSILARASWGRTLTPTPTSGSHIIGGGGSPHPGTYRSSTSATKVLSVEPSTVDVDGRSNVRPASALSERRHFDGPALVADTDDTDWHPLQMQGSASPPSSFSKTASPGSGPRYSIPHTPGSGVTQRSAISRPSSGLARCNSPFTQVLGDVRTLHRLAEFEDCLLDASESHGQLSPPGGDGDTAAVSPSPSSKRGLKDGGDDTPPSGARRSLSPGTATTAATGEGITFHPLYGEVVKNGEKDIVFRSNAFFRFRGNFEDNIAEGVGFLQLADGSSVQGEFHSGEITGKGVRYWPNGTSYRGDLQLGEPHGLGVTTYPSGEQYEGEYSRGLRHGKGTLLFRTEKAVPCEQPTDGKSTVGTTTTNAANQQHRVTIQQFAGAGFGRQFSMAMPTRNVSFGFCKQDSTTTPLIPKSSVSQFFNDREDLLDLASDGGGGDNDGAIPPLSEEQQEELEAHLLDLREKYEWNRYEGDFVRHKFHGAGTLTTPKGVFTGDFVDNDLTGFGRAQYANGDTVEGEFKNKVPNGRCVFTSTSSGIVYTGEMKDGQRAGVPNALVPHSWRVETMVSPPRERAVKSPTTTPRSPGKAKASSSMTASKTPSLLSSMLPPPIVGIAGPPIKQTVNLPLLNPLAVSSLAAAKLPHHHRQSCAPGGTSYIHSPTAIFQALGMAPPSTSTSGGHQQQLQGDPKAMQIPYGTTSVSISVQLAQLREGLPPGAATSGGSIGGGGDVGGGGGGQPTTTGRPRRVSIFAGTPQGSFNAGSPHSVSSGSPPSSAIQQVFQDDGWVVEARLTKPTAPPSASNISARNASVASMSASMLSPQPSISTEAGASLMNVFAGLPESNACEEYLFFLPETPEEVMQRAFAEHQVHLAAVANLPKKSRNAFGEASFLSTTSPSKGGTPSKGKQQGRKSSQQDPGGAPGLMPPAWLTQLPLTSFLSTHTKDGIATFLFCPTPSVEPGIYSLVFSFNSFVSVAPSEGPTFLKAAAGPKELTVPVRIVARKAEDGKGGMRSISTTPRSSEHVS